MSQAEENQRVSDVEQDAAERHARHRLDHEQDAAVVLLRLLAQSQQPLRVRR